MPPRLTAFRPDGFRLRGRAELFTGQGRFRGWEQGGGGLPGDSSRVSLKRNIALPNFLEIWDPSRAVTLLETDPA